MALIGVSATLGQGTELWVNPGINQGFGLADTHGAAGFSSAEAHNLGAEYLYARVDRFSFGKPSIWDAPPKRWRSTPISLPTQQQRIVRC